MTLISMPAMKRIIVVMLLALDAQAASAQSFGFGIESMRAHSYSVGIFIFMMIAIAVFVGIIWAFFRQHAGEAVKPGEKVLFLMITFGVVVAAIFAAVQLLDGFLF
ncbi:MAG: hypothetical protein D6678_00560 [Zetaproteobacteria bacterium]|nr:MAG: hypothetical protein D6678_00560 [Zetaproteobacteria bacterium]